MKTPRFFSIKAFMSTGEHVPFSDCLTEGDLTDDEITRLSNIDEDDQYCFFYQWEIPLDPVKLDSLFNKEISQLKKEIEWSADGGGDLFDDYLPDYLRTMISILENMGVTLQKDYPLLWESVREHIAKFMNRFIHNMNLKHPDWANHSEINRYSDYYEIALGLDNLIFGETIEIKDNVITHETAFSPKLIME